MIQRNHKIIIKIEILFKNRNLVKNPPKNKKIQKIIIEKKTKSKNAKHNRIKLQKN